MARTKAMKAEHKENVGSKFARAKAAVVAEYRGLSANDLAALRVELNKVKGEFQIVKNRVAKKALEGNENFAPFAKDLHGPIGVAYFYEDVAAAAKSMLAFANGKDNFNVRSGMMEARVLSVVDLKAISDLPSKEVLLAQIIGSLVSPHRGLLYVLNGVGTQLVRVISAIKDKKAE